MNYCFGDFEFTCGGKANYIGGELLSVGIVICDDDFNVLEKFYSTIRPIANRKLHKRCVDITHLSQEEIDESRESNVVCRELCELFEKYGIKSVNVWGNYDVVGIKSDVKLHRRKSLGFKYVATLGGMIQDCQSAVVKQIGTISNFSLSKLPEFFKSTQGLIAHNSMTDAMVLYEVYKNAFSKDCDREPAFAEFIKGEQEKYRVQIKERENLRKKKIASLSKDERELLMEISQKYGRKSERVFFMYYKILKNAMKKNEKSDIVVFYTRNFCVIDPIENIDIEEKKSMLMSLVDCKMYSKNNTVEIMREIMTYYNDNIRDLKKTGAKR